MYKFNKVQTTNMELKEFFQRKKFVELAYLFGSAAKGKHNKLSDIDIGVYLSENLSQKEKNQKRLELIAGLTTLLKSDKVDLVVMNGASAAVNFEIIKANAPIFVRNRELKLDVEQRIMSSYLDRKFHEERLNKAFLERVKARGLA